MWNLKSDRSFREFLLGGSHSSVWILLLAGVALILIGSFIGGDRDGMPEATLEERVSEMCSLTEGVGACRVMISYADDGESVYAVAVLCDGADSAEVRSRVVELVGSLFGIGANRITVLKISK